MTDERNDDDPFSFPVEEPSDQPSEQQSSERPADAPDPDGTSSDASPGGAVAHVDDDAVDETLPSEANLPIDDPVGGPATEGEGISPTASGPEPAASGPDPASAGANPAASAGDSPGPGTDSDEATAPQETDAERSAATTAAIDEIVATAREAFAERDGPLPTPAEDDLRDRYFAFDYLDRYEEIERTWVSKPDAYISVVYDHDEDTHRYHVTEPSLDAFEAYIRRDLEGELRDRLMYEDVDDDTDRRTVVADRADDLLVEYAERVDPLSLAKVRYYLLREFVGVGKIDPIMGDPDVEDVSCVGADLPVYVYHNAYRDLATNVSFGDEALNAFVSRLAARSGKHISVSNPLVDATMPDGSRVQLTLGHDISSRGSNFTVRKFSEVPRTPIQLIEWGTYSVDMMAYLWLAVQHDMSMLFAGGTASGKTTTMNACGFFIPPDSKVVTIEDTREITLPHDNWIQSVSRDAFGADRRGEITTHDLLQAGLRQRPEFLLVGEMRTEREVALTFFQAIATGHSGYSTVHADSVESVFDRLRNAPLEVPDQLLRALDVVAVQRQQFVDGRRVRRTTELVELVRTRDGSIGTNTMFDWDPRTDSYGSDARSYVFDRIKEDRGWSDRKLRREYDARRVVLEFLRRNDIVDYRPVTRTLHAFARRPDAIVDAIRSGELDPTDESERLLSDVTVEPPGR